MQYGDNLERKFTIALPWNPFKGDIIPFSISQIADMKHCSVGHALNMVKCGLLQAYRFNSIWIIEPTQIRRLVIGKRAPHAMESYLLPAVPAPTPEK